MDNQHLQKVKKCKLKPTMLKLFKEHANIKIKLTHKKCVISQAKFYLNFDQC